MFFLEFISCGTSSLYLLSHSVTVSLLLSLSTCKSFQQTGTYVNAPHNPLSSYAICLWGLPSMVQINLCNRILDARTSSVLAVSHTIYRLKPLIVRSCLLQPKIPTVPTFIFFILFCRVVDLSSNCYLSRRKTNKTQTKPVQILKA